MTNKNNILVDISDDLNIISSGMPLMSVEEIINQYPDLTKVSKLLRFDKEKAFKPTSKCHCSAGQHKRCSRCNLYMDSEAKKNSAFSFYVCWY